MSPLEILNDPNHWRSRLNFFSLAARPGSKVRIDLDVDLEGRHTMEDVIDEFVEEINEEDELEHQIVERQLVEGQPVEVQQQDGQLAQGQLGEGQMVEEKTRRRRKRGRNDD